MGMGDGPGTVAVDGLTKREQWIWVTFIVICINLLPVFPLFSAFFSSSRFLGILVFYAVTIACFTSIYCAYDREEVADWTNSVLLGIVGLKKLGSHVNRICWYGRQQLRRFFAVIGQYGWLSVSIASSLTDSISTDPTTDVFNRSCWSVHSPSSSTPSSLFSWQLLPSSSSRCGIGHASFLTDWHLRGNSSAHSSWRAGDMNRQL